MSNLDKFIAETNVQPPVPEGMDFSASVRCTTCGEEVDGQKYFPQEALLIWRCSKGHRSVLENFSIF